MANGTTKIRIDVTEGLKTTDNVARGTIVSTTQSLGKAGDDVVIAGETIMNILGNMAIQAKAENGQEMIFTGVIKKNSRYKEGSKDNPEWFCCYVEDGSAELPTTLVKQPAHALTPATPVEPKSLLLRALGGLATLVKLDEEKLGKEITEELLGSNKFNILDPKSVNEAKTAIENQIKAVRVERARTIERALIDILRDRAEEIWVILSDSGFTSEELPDSDRIEALLQGLLSEAERSQAEVVTSETPITAEAQTSVRKTQSTTGLTTQIASTSAGKKLLELQGELAQGGGSSDGPPIHSTSFAETPLTREPVG